VGEEPLNSRFEVVGYLIPSNTGRSYKVVIDGRFYGLIPIGALLHALRCKPVLQVEISRFIDSPFEKKQTSQALLTTPTADPEKIPAGEEGNQ